MEHGSNTKEGTMGFSGTRALIMVGVLVALGIAVFKFDLPGWILPVGLILTGAVLKGAEQQASE
jgi:hypothetical protein